MKVTLSEKDIQTAIKFWAAAKFPQYDIVLDRVYMLSGDVDVVLTERGVDAKVEQVFATAAAIEEDSPL